MGRRDDVGEEATRRYTRSEKDTHLSCETTSACSLRAGAAVLVTVTWTQQLSGGSSRWIHASGALVWIDSLTPLAYCGVCLLPLGVLWEDSIALSI